MKLTSPERKILEYIEMYASTPLEKMAKKLGMRAHSIRYYIEKFKNSNIITARAFIDTYRLGYLTYLVRFSVKGAGEDVLRLLRNFQTSDKVSWLIEMGGDYQYEAQLTVRSLKEFITFFDDIDSSPTGVISAKNVVLLTSYTFFGTRCMSSLSSVNSNEGLFNASMSICDERVEIDKIDHHLLRLLMIDDMASESKMARVLGLPATTVSHRIRVLEKKEVIKAYMYTIAGGQIGLSYYLLLISLRGMNQKFFTNIQKLCDQLPCIRSLVRSIGNWDIEIRLSVEHHQQVIETTQSLQVSLGQSIIDLKVIPYFSLLKMQDYPFTNFMEPKS